MVGETCPNFPQFHSSEATVSRRCSQEVSTKDDCVSAAFLCLATACKVTGIAFLGLLVVGFQSHPYFRCYVVIASSLVFLSLLFSIYFWKRVCDDGSRGRQTLEEAFWIRTSSIEHLNIFQDWRYRDVLERCPGYNPGHRVDDIETGDVRDAVATIVECSETISEDGSV